LLQFAHIYPVGSGISGCERYVSSGISVIWHVPFVEISQIIVIGLVESDSLQQPEEMT
jgi:hypothetical protein